MARRFQVNLGGVIDLLAHHLYSSPAVFARELLQNATDAITARTQLEPKLKGEIRIEVREADGGRRLVVEDNGIGLTEAEVHQFLATIGESSKRGELAERRTDFIGQFGIGLLSCFMVTDEILVDTRSARSPSAPTVRWAGLTDGTYSVKPSPEPLAQPGTRVTLRSRDGHAEDFEPQRVRELLTHYGALLPIPISFLDGGREHRIGGQPPPWMKKTRDAKARRTALLAYGREVFGEEFLDAIPLKSAEGEVEGVAFVQATSSHFGAQQRHRVYLKRMLLSEDADNLLPSWAFFVRAVVNANALRPTASREGFYEDETLLEVQKDLGDQLREYLMQLGREAPETLQALISLHGLAMRALCLDNDDFMRVVGDFLPFETSLGVMTLGELRRRSPIRYAATVDEFRQVSRIAHAHGLCVVNAGYVHGIELLEKVPAIFSDAQVERFAPDELTEAMESLDLDERERAQALARAARRALEPHRVDVELLKFHPIDVPAIFAASAEAQFDRAAEQTQADADDLYGGLINEVRASRPAPRSKLVLNFHNPVIERLRNVTDETAVKSLVEVLYVQALMLGQRPLSAHELTLLNRGLSFLMASHLGLTRMQVH